MGRGASQSWGWVSIDLWRVCSSGVGERHLMSSLVVMGCVPVSTITMTRSGALWSPSSLGSLTNGCMDELACRVMAADAHGGVGRAFPINDMGIYL